jgi:hypothetical protein
MAFRIRPADPETVQAPVAVPVAPRPPRPEPVREPEPEVAESPADGMDHTGGRFRDAGDALAFLGGIGGAGLASEARAWRGPGGRWWADVPVPWQRAASLVESAGGEPYAGQGNRWVALSRTGGGPEKVARRARPREGELVLYSRSGSERLDASQWQEVALEDMLVAAPLRPAPMPALSEVLVVAPGLLARTLLERAAGLGFTTELAPATRTPLDGSGPASSALFMRIRWERRPTAPRAFLSALTRLPYVAVGRPAGAPRDPERGIGLVLDIRYRLPLANSLVSALVPDGEAWFLGGPDIGHFRLDISGELRDGGSFLSVPRPAQEAPAPPPSNTDPLPPPLLVRLVPRTPLPGIPEAVLVDDTELGWTRSFLAGRGLGDEVLLALGPGAHLLMAPGGLLGSLPFGTPLRRIGPGALLMEEGQDFSPRLPESARAAAFRCDPGQVVAIVRGTEPGGFRVLRFQLANATPAWTLWLGVAPEIAEGVKGKEAERLLALAKQIAPPQSMMDRLKGAMGKDRTRPAGASRDQLLREAMQAELSGQLQRAAELLEQAGDLVAAGRMYERAATQE